MICDHNGPCRAELSASNCARKQAASATRYSVETWLINEFEPGWFALMSALRREIHLITNDWNEVLAAYRARPPYVQPQPKPRKGPDLDKLEFKL